MARRLITLLLCVFLVGGVFLPFYIPEQVGDEKNVSQGFIQRTGVTDGMVSEGQIQVDNSTLVISGEAIKSGNLWNRILVLAYCWGGVLLMFAFGYHIYIFSYWSHKKLPVLRFLKELDARQRKDGKKKKIAF